MAAPGIKGQAPLQVTNEIAKLLATDGEAGDRPGFSVAVSGDTAVVGAPHDSDNGGVSGSAYVFVRNGTSWDQQAKLVASDGFAGDSFGSSVAVSGNTVVVAAHGNDDNGDFSGSAYVFVRSGTTWSQQAKLLAADGTPLDALGASALALSGDTVVAGAHGHPNGDNFGAAYVFVRSGTSWAQQAKLLPTDGEAGDFFGVSVDVSGDTAVVGAFVDGDHSGSAYVFVRSGTVWSQQAKLLGSGTTSHFGLSVAVSGDTAVVGGGDDDGVGGSGAAWVFVRDGTSWSQQAKMLPSDGALGDQFGGRLAVSGDTAVVGASQDDDQGKNSGSAYVFRRSGTNWCQQTKLLASDGAQDDWFGAWSVAVSGSTAVVAADLDDDQGENSGSAYVFDLGPQNHPPTADAGLNRAVRVGDTVMLDGTASFDDNTATADLLFDWSFSTLPPFSNAVLVGANTATPSFEVDVADTYVAQLVVTDEEGAVCGSAEVVLSSDNLAPTAAAGDDQLVTVGTMVFLDGIGSTDPEMDPLTYAWTLTAVPAGSSASLDGGSTQTPTFVADREGLYVAHLEVSDFIGPGTPDTVAVTATTAHGSAEFHIVSACNVITNLRPDQVTTEGNRRALCNFLGQAVRALQKDHPATAIDKLDKTIERTDGCALRGAPDGNGPGRDWITACDAQAEVYGSLTEALAAITP